MFKRVLIIGGGRGLGRSLALFSATHLEDLEHLDLVGRKEPFLKTALKEIRKGDAHDARNPLKESCALSYYCHDLATSEGQERCLELIDKNQYDLILYVAGGGPHGPYGSKNWKDHLWALQVTLISPMRLAHHWLSLNSSTAGHFVVVGSRVAESSPDALASSYAAGKHGLLGWVSSLQDELKDGVKKVWLFSPGYLDTEMLPKTATVRNDGSQIMSPATAAQALLRWIKKDGPWHRVLK